MKDREFNEWLKGKRVFYFSKGDALECIDWCNSRAIAVIGIDVFQKRGSELVPDLDGICDWSGGNSANWEEYYQQRNMWSKDFVYALPDDEECFVELVPLTKQREIEYRRKDEIRRQENQH